MLTLQWTMFDASRSRSVLSVAPVVVAIASCATPARRGRIEHRQLVDLTADFVARVCSLRSGTSFARGWLAHERRHWPAYRSLYYRHALADRVRRRRALELAGARSRVCSRVRAVAALGPGAVRTLSARVTSLFGSRSTPDIFLAVPLLGDDGLTRYGPRGAVLAFNAWHATFTRVRGLAVTIAHELAHAAQHARYGDRLLALKPIERDLYSEGGAVFTVQTLFPEVGLGALGLSPMELAWARRAIPHAASRLLSLLKAGETSAQQRGRFFSGRGTRSLPRKMGYLLGAMVYATLAANKSPADALRVEPRAFVRQAVIMLAGLSEQRGEFRQAGVWVPRFTQVTESASRLSD